MAPSASVRLYVVSVKTSPLGSMLPFSLAVLIVAPTYMSLVSCIFASAFKSVSSKDKLTSWASVSMRTMHLPS